LKTGSFGLQKTGINKAGKSCLPLPKQPPLSGPKAGFQAWGDGRRKKSIYVRHNKAAERAVAIRAFKAEHPDMSNRMIAKVFDVDERTIRRDLES
jgi:hypothetical protein